MDFKKLFYSFSKYGFIISEITMFFLILISLIINERLSYYVTLIYFWYIILLPVYYLFVFPRLMKKIGEGLFNTFRFIFYNYIFFYTLIFLRIGIYLLIKIIVETGV